jgi:23S rRNA (cytosine1962-C5)-methyltransferase
MNHSSINITLKRGKEEPVRRRHPWVFSGAIAQLKGQPADGDVVKVFDFNQTLLGVGHFHHGSIAVRLLSFDDADLQHPAFWQQRFEAAFQVRVAAQLSGRADLNTFRLVHGEGDQLSGLIVDIYGSTAVVQCHSIGMHRQREHIAAGLRSVAGLGLQAIYDKSTESLPPNYAAHQKNSYLWQANADAATDEAVVLENGVQFRVNWATGQKTGFFLDQRDNRQLLGQHAAGRSVMNAFCYTGGFSCYALQAGATQVDSIDISGKAMELTAANAALNTPANDQRHQCYTADVMAFLRENERLYEVAVVDPPAFAKSLEKRHNAVQAYKRLNELALRRVQAGGLLFTFSCSQVVGRDLFYGAVAAAAIESGRNIRVLHHLTQGADHPVSIFHPEGAYLKGLVLHVS